MAVTMFYRLDLNDGANNVFSLEPATAPVAFAVGDFVDPSGWTGNGLPLNQHYQISAVEHQLTFPGGDECQHNVVVSLKAVPR